MLTDNSIIAMEQLDNPICPQHARLIEYFCQDDQEPICSRCYIMGEHKDHTIVSLEEKNKHIITSIDNEMEAATVVLNKLSKMDKGSVDRKLRNEKSKLVETVSQSFHQLHQVLKQREKEVLDEISVAYKNRSVSVGEMILNLKNEKQTLEKALHQSSRLLDNPALVVTDGEGLLKVVTGARKIPCIFSDTSSLPSQLEWDMSGIDNLSNAIQSFGTVGGDKEEKFQLKTIDESPESIADEDKILKLPPLPPLTSQKSCDTYSVSSVDTGEDVIIESDVESIISTATTMSSRSNQSSGAHKEITFPQVKGSLKEITVTHIRSPNDFCVQLLVNKGKLENLSRNMNAWCRKKSSANHVPTEVKNGMYVLGCYSADNQWYRARVVDVDMPKGGDGDNEMKVHVVYYDFGNEERVPWKSLRTMQPRFEIYPSFCIHCSLYDIAPLNNSSAWDGNSIQEFFRITNNQILLLNVIAMKGPVYEVDLICTPVEDTLEDKYSSVRDILIFLELGRFARPSRKNVLNRSGTRMKTYDYFKPTSLPNGDIVEMIVSEACSPSDFYIMPGGDEYLYYLNMMEEMQELYDRDTTGLYTMYLPCEDALCVVKGTDEKWHRGKIVTKPVNNNVTVYLTDIGSTSVVPYDRIKKLLTNFIKLPSQAVRCKLADVGMTDSATTDWSEDAKVWCQTDLKGSQGNVRIVRWGKLTEVVLWVGGNTTSINALLVEAGLAVSSGLASMPVSKNNIPVSQSATPVSPKSSSPKRVVKDRGDIKNMPARHRAASNVSISSHSSTVSLTSEASAVALPESPAVSPRKESTENKSISSISKSKSPNAKMSKKPKKSLDARKPPKESEVDIISAEKNARKQKVQEDITKAIEGNSEESSGDSKSSKSTYIEIIISFYTSPTDFFIRVQENEGRLFELMEELNKEYKDSNPVPEQTWNINDCCVVRHGSDGLWYRGKIISRISATELEVEFLDYGNTGCICENEMRPLTRDLGTCLPRAAVRCHLAYLIPTGTSDRNKWSKTATEFMANIISSKKLYIKTEGEPTDERLPIDIIVEDEIPETAFDPVTYTYQSLRQILIDQGLAMSNKPRKSSTTPSSPSTHQSEKLQEKEFCSSEETESMSATVPEMVEIPPYSIPDLNEEIEVIPMFIDYSGVIYTQRIDWDDQVEHLSLELQRVYKDSPYRPLEWQPGHTCVAPFVDDGLWYRGLIEEVHAGKAKVFYVDFGNSAWVSLDKLRELHGPFVDYHVQVYHCVLEDLIPNTQDGVWPIVLLDVMHELVVNCQCSMVYRGMEDNGHLKIQLCKPTGFDLSSYLVEKGYAVSTMDLTDRFANSQAIGAVLSSCALCSPPDVGGAGSVFRAIATEVELPNIVYVQRTPVEESTVHDFAKASEIAEINRELEQFQRIMVEINTTPSSGFIKLPDTGMLCLGKFHMDNNWYRALCVQRYPQVDSCLVSFVDYGTSEIISRDRMRSLPSQFWSLPCQGVRCYLNLLPPGGPNAVWKKNSLDAMISSLGQKELIVKVIQSKPLTVELLVETESGEMSLAYEGMVQRGLAILPMQIDMDVLLQGAGSVNSKEVDVEVEDDDDDAIKSVGKVVSRDAGDVVNVSRVCEEKEDGKMNQTSEVKSETEVSQTVAVPSGIDGSEKEDDEDDWTTDSDDDEFEECISRESEV